MSRYPIKVVSTDEAFGPDVKIGVQLKAETPIVVPDPCPECPESGCVVECYGWLIGSYFPLPGPTIGGGPLFVTPGDFVDGEYLIRYSTGSVILLVPMGEFCGHKLRIVVDEGDWDSHTLSYTDTATLTPRAQILFDFWTPDSEKTGTVKAQIDLTDADEGAETWTDICGTIRITAGHGQ